MVNGVPPKATGPKLTKASAVPSNTTYFPVYDVPMPPVAVHVGVLDPVSSKPAVDRSVPVVMFPKAFGWKK